MVSRRVEQSGECQIPAGLLLLLLATVVVGMTGELLHHSLVSVHSISERKSRIRRVEGIAEQVKLSASWKAF